MLMNAPDLLRHHLNPLPAVKLPSDFVIIAWLLLFCSPLSGQELKPRLTLLGHKARVMNVAVSPDGKTLASGGDDVTIRFWDVASGKQQNTIKVADEAEWIGSLAFSSDGKMLVSGGSGSGANTVKLWDVGTRKGVTLQEEGQCMLPVAVFSPDSKTVASASTFLNETPLTFWDATTRKRVAKTEKVFSVEALAFTPDGKTAVALGRNGGITSVQTATGKITATMKTAEDSFSAAAFSPDAKILATATWDETTVKLRAVATGKELLAIKGPASRVSCMVFSPDGKTLVTGCENGAIKCWNVATGKVAATLTGHEGVRCLAFSPDGKVLVSGSEDETIKIWDIPPQK
jgi:WD40 repeat protein